MQTFYVPTYSYISSITFQRFSVKARRCILSGVTDIGQSCILPVFCQRALMSMFVGEMSVGEMSVGKMSVGKMSVGEMSVGEMSVGKMSVGEMSVGEMSQLR